MREKVFGIGLSKTGTKTLGACLGRLGYDHFTWDRKFAKQVLVDGNLDLLDETAEKFDSFDDLPWPLFYRRLDRRYPDARFILTVRRSSDAWFESIRRHAEYKGPTDVREQVYGYAMPHGHRQGHTDVYERHVRQVQEYFAGRPEKLLVICWESESSWDRLCAFLNRPVPDLPLPHENARRPARISGYLRRVRYTLQGYAQRLFLAGPG